MKRSYKKLRLTSGLSQQLFRTNYSGNKKYISVFFQILLGVLCLINSAISQTTIYSTDFGAVANVNPSAWTFTGADMTISTNSASTGYTGASGGAYLGEGNSTAFINTAGTSFPASQIGSSTATVQTSTVGYDNISISFGMRKSSAGYNTNATYSLEWSTDGTIFTPISYTESSAGSWGLASGAGLSLPIGAANQPTLFLKWTFNRTGTASNYKIDDFKVVGTNTPPPDITPPNLISAKATGFNQILAVYNEQVSIATATNSLNYSASPAIVISTITLSLTKDTAFINLASPLINGSNYTLTASSITDLSGNAMASPQSKNFFFEKIIVDHYEWRTPPQIGTYQGQNLKNGGFSGLQYIPGTDKEFLAVTDRGPNLDANNNSHALAMGGLNNTAKLFPLPSFNPQMIRLKADGDSLIFISSTTIKRPDNNNASGLTNPAGIGGSGEIGLADTAGTLTPTDVWGIDSEGLTAGNDNDYWIPEEYGVSIWHIDSNGKAINRYAPYGGTGAAQPQDIAIDTIFNYRNPNKGFEGVAFSPNGKVYGFIQNTILFPASDINLKKNTRLHRFVEIDPTTNATRMLGYEHDKWNSSGPLSSIKNDKRYIGDAIAINDHEFLILEHGKSSTEHYAKVYKIDIANATAINPINHLGYGGNSFEQLIDSTTCAANGITVVKKTLFLDLIASGYDNALDKEEGLTIINDTTIAIANDNDFGIVSTASDGVMSLTGGKSYIYTFIVPQYKKLNLCLPATISAASTTTFCQGGSVVLNVPTVAGATYDWKLNGSSISGANSNSYSVSATGNYSVTVVNSSGCIANSNNKNIIVNPIPLSAITAGGATTFCSGGSITLTTPAGNNYQWQLNGSSISGAISNSYITNASGNYSVVVTDLNSCSSTSAPETITVNPLPSATISAGGPTTFCSGSSVTFNTPAGNTYQWKFNGTNISGATTNNYTANASGNYSVVVTNSSGCVNSSPVQTVTVNPMPSSVIAASGPTSFCQGDSVLLSSSVGTSYQWVFNSSNISGATSSTYNIINQGNYNVTVSNGSCAATSAGMFVTVNSLPLIPVITQSGTMLTSSAASTYQWYFNGSVISGATLQTYNISANGTYFVVVTNASGCDSSSTPLVVSTTDVIDMANSNGVNVYPNPYSESTSIEITLSVNAIVTAEVYSVLGEKIQTLVSSPLASGKHNFNFGAKESGYSAGIYFIKVTINDKVYVTRIIEKN